VTHQKIKDSKNLVRFFWNQHVDIFNEEGFEQKFHQLEKFPKNASPSRLGGSGRGQCMITIPVTISVFYFSAPSPRGHFLQQHSVS